MVNKKADHCLLLSGGNGLLETLYFKFECANIHICLYAYMYLLLNVYMQKCNYA
jgi:hypothetical protein